MATIFQIKELYHHATDTSDLQRAYFANALFKVAGGVAIISQCVPRVSFDQLRFLLSPYPMVEFLPALIRYLSEMGYFRYDWESQYIFINPNMRDAVLSYIPKGTPSDTQGFRIKFLAIAKKKQPFPMYNESPFTEKYLPFTQYGLTEHMATYHALRHAWFLDTDYRTIADFEPVFLQMEYELINEDYDQIAFELTDIDDAYLIPWGHLDIAEMWHKQVQGKIKNPNIRAVQEGHLGFVYKAKGKMYDAIRQYEIATAVNWDVGDVDGVVVWMSNMGSIYADLGQIETAITYTQQALSCTASITNTIRRNDEQSRLMNNLCIYYRQLGDYEMAISYIEQAIALTEEFGGDNEISRWSGTLGETYILMGDYEKAKPILIEAVDMWLNTKFLNTHLLIELARLLWYMGDIETAHQYISIDEKYDADDRSLMWVMRGCIELSRKNHQQAQTHFEQALAWSSRYIAQTQELFCEHDVQGLAYVGLWCISDDETYLNHAQKAYQTARRICGAKGVIVENRQMLNTLMTYAQKSHPTIGGLLHGE